MGRPVIDLGGSRYGMLSVLRKNTDIPGGSHISAHWIVRCDCGVERTIRSDVLRSNKQQSCGCFRGKNQKDTLGIPMIAYRRWASMMKRCYSPRTEKDKRNYMDRGITVANEWHDPRVFYKDMGTPPFEGATLDRRDNNSGYSKDNCRWATWSEQNKNRRPFKNKVKEVCH